MLNSGKKINILTLVLSEKKILNETKKQVKWLVPKRVPDDGNSKNASCTHNCISTFLFNHDGSITAELLLNVQLTLWFTKTFISLHIQYTHVSKQRPV